MGVEQLLSLAPTLKRLCLKGCARLMNPIFASKSLQWYGWNEGGSNHLYFEWEREIERMCESTRVLVTSFNSKIKEIIILSAEEHCIH
jgi:hypothetical protein